MSEDDVQVRELLRRIEAGETEAAALLLHRDRDRLRRMVETRLDPRLRQRFSVSDVLQDIDLVATRRLTDYLQKRPMPFFLWLRYLAGQHLVELARHHLGAERRDVRREVDGSLLYSASSIDYLARGLATDETSPTQAVMREEEAKRLHRALEALESCDREVLSLRHYEHLTNEEVARELGIEPAAASKRHVRALKRLRELMRVERRGDES